MKKLISLALLLAPFAVVTLIFGTIYATVQQEQRQAANDPQIQMAEDNVGMLDGENSPKQIIGPVSVDPETSLAPFVVLYDRSGQVLASGGSINGESPVIPTGVLKQSDGKTYYAVTWQPQQNIRLAAVVVAGRNGYVVAARSLKEVEQREDKTQLITMIGWALSELILAVYLVVPKNRIKR